MCSRDLGVCCACLCVLWVKYIDLVRKRAAETDLVPCRRSTVGWLAVSCSGAARVVVVVVAEVATGGSVCYWSTVGRPVKHVQPAKMWN